MLGVIEDTLNVYPEVKGIQIMNDMGDYMFDSYRGSGFRIRPRAATNHVNTCEHGTRSATAALLKA